MFVDFAYKKSNGTETLNLVKTKDFIVKILGLNTVKDLQMPLFFKGKYFFSFFVKFLFIIHCKLSIYFKFKVIGTYVKITLCRYQ